MNRTRSKNGAGSGTRKSRMTVRTMFGIQIMGKLLEQQIII